MGRVLLFTAVVAFPLPLLNVALLAHDETGAAFEVAAVAGRFFWQENGTAAVVLAARTAVGVVGSPFLVNGMRVVPGEAWGVDDALTQVFDDLASVPQGIAALRRPPGENEIIQRPPDPLLQGCFVVGGAGAAAEKQCGNQGFFHAFSCRLIKFSRRGAAGKLA